MTRRSYYLRLRRLTLLCLAVSFYTLLFVMFSARSPPPANATSDEATNKQYLDTRQKHPRPWLVIANQTNCNKVVGSHLMGPAGPLPATSLLSVQGSGNTWLRYLIERLTGVCTGSVYKEKQMFLAGFRCELQPLTDGRTIGQKSHYFYHHLTNKTLLLIRFPLDALIADYHRLKTQGNHTGLANSRVFSDREWDNFVTVRAGEWLSLILQALHQSSELLVVFYENLQTNLHRELTRIAEFLQVYVAPQRLQCVLANHGKKFKRKRDPHDPVVTFSTAQTILVHQFVAHTVVMFRKYHVPDIPLKYLTAMETVPDVLKEFSAQ